MPARKSTRSSPWSAASIWRPRRSAIRDCCWRRWTSRWRRRRCCEGGGGSMVPLRGRYTVLDWMRALNIPLIVVAGSYLGTISHTLTALEVVARGKLKVQAWVVNDSGDGAVPLDETVATLRRFVGVPTLTIPRVKTPVGGAREVTRLR